MTVGGCLSRAAPRRPGEGGLGRGSRPADSPGRAHRGCQVGARAPWTGLIRNLIAQAAYPRLSGEHWSDADSFLSEGCAPLTDAPPAAPAAARGLSDLRIGEGRVQRGMGT